MNPCLKCLLLLLGLLLAVPGPAQERRRAAVPVRYHWQLTDIYPSVAAWKEAEQKFRAGLPALERFRGTLCTSSRALLDCLALRSRLNRDFLRLFTYINLSLDRDLGDQANLALQQELNQLGVVFEEKTSFIEPEILAADADTIRSFFGDCPDLDVYRHYLNELLRGRTHIGSAAEEKILALSGLLADAPATIHDVFIHADFPYPQMTLAGGETATIDRSAFQRLRASANREERRQALAAFLGRFNEYRRTFGAQLNAQMGRDVFFARARNYSSCLERSLDGDNIPVAVYTSLVDNVNRNLGALHRYLKLRKRILGVEQLHNYDLAAPLLAGGEPEYSIDEAEKHLLAAFKPLGREYVSAVRQAFDQRWIDIYPAAGKRSGGYANCWAYDVHPYILLNYQNRYGDMSGLAHELGHAMHGFLSNSHQPFELAAPPRFVVEVAATFNEALLQDYMLRQTTNDETRLLLLGSFLENMVTTVFRATQISEFELRIHEMAERGEQLTGDGLNGLYLEIAKKYYGHDQQVCVVDDEAKAGWMFIPQLYSSFYAYQYATAYTASQALSELVLQGDPTATAAYIGFLSSGGSDYAINLLKKAGVDMTTAKPFDLAIRKMNRVMDEMESILQRKEG